MYAAWLLLSFVARVVVYGTLAFGYAVGENPECPETPTVDCDSCQHPFYVLTNTIENVPSM
jgi:hypothetical protein